MKSSHGGFIFSYTIEKYDTTESTKPPPLSSKSTSASSKKLTVSHIHRHHHENDDEAFITAMFWAFFSLGRLASIYIATKFSSAFMLSIDIVSTSQNNKSVKLT